MNVESLPGTTSLLATVGLQGDFSLHPLTGGANNRVFRVEAQDSRMLLKVYFQHPNDPRDRLGTEFAFSSFAWKNGVEVIPRPLACDPHNRLGLYEFVSGRLLQPEEVTENSVQQAINFYCHLNFHKQLPIAAVLPMASEACFSLDAHLQCVEQRVQNLRGVNGQADVDREAVDFIQNELSETWRNVIGTVRGRAMEIGLSLENELPWQERCISPSDFGFHNALLTDDGRLRFIDFEYAGWDDPAKTVCDFFCQPALPVPLEYYGTFIDAVVAGLQEPQKHCQRIDLLLPVYQIKWCCILLNNFLEVGSWRRHFAGETVDQEEQKVRQLQKARMALQSLVSNISHKT